MKFRVWQQTCYSVGIEMRTIVFMLVAGALSAPAIARDLSPEVLQKAKGFSWQSRKSNNFDFYVETGTFAHRNLDNIARDMELSRGRVEKVLGWPSPQRNSVFIVDSRARMQELVGLETNGLATGSTVFAVYSETIQGLGAHEVCHNLAVSVWGKNKGIWISEGLAVYADDSWQGLPLHSVAKWLLDHDKLVPVKELIDDGKMRKYPDIVTYPELGSFVKFLYEFYGREAVKTLWREGAKGAARAFPGKTLDQVEMEWRDRLAKVDASSLSYKL